MKFVSKVPSDFLGSVITWIITIHRNVRLVPSGAISLTLTERCSLFKGILQVFARALAFFSLPQLQNTRGFLIK